MNILFTCAGRRNYLLRFFRQELAGDGQVLAADVDPTAPALQDADRRFIVPRVDDPRYIETLLDLCRRHEVGLLISLNDLELPILAKHRQAFLDAGTRVLVSDPETVDICFDKVRTNRFLAQNGFSHPLTYLSLDDVRVALDSGRVGFPLIVKPRWGSASVQLYRVFDWRELELAFALASIELRRSILRDAGSPGQGGIIVQECLPGDEYGVDVLNDLDGRFRTAYVKRKLGMRAGETEKSRLVEIPVLQELAERLGRSTGHIANLDCDVFYDGQRATILELNPRFGGGYPFSHVLGANYPRAIIDWARGRPFDTGVFTRNASDTVSKCDELIVVTPDT